MVKKHKKIGYYKGYMYLCETMTMNILTYMPMPMPIVVHGGGGSVAAETDIKINLQKVMYCGAYLLGAQMTANKLIPYVMQNYRGDDKVYIKAELDMITSSKRNMQLWLDGTTRIAYRNHKRNKKGKLESCECYFVELERNNGGEIKGNDEKINNK